MSDYLDGLRGPTVRELRAIEAEWPAIAADLADVDRLTRLLAAPAGHRPATQDPAGYPAAA